MRSKLAFPLLCLLAGWASAAWPLIIDQPLPDAAQEARAKALFHDIRCVVCQGETIADSPADIAGDMRHVVRAQVADGKNDADIKAYLVSRYGNAILMQPPLIASTLLLWFGPALILCIALAVIGLYFHKSRQGTQP